MRDVTLVTGPPCAGKSTYVDRHAQPGDLVVCFDLLARKAGSRNRHRHTREQRAAAGAAFRRLTATLPAHQGRAWVIRCAGTAEERSALADEVQATAVLVLKPPVETCLRRAEVAGREPRVPSVIRRWYVEHTSLDRDQLIEPGGVPGW